jgi:4'-phosphopantetheinyl transferase
MQNQLQNIYFKDLTEHKKIDLKERTIILYTEFNKELAINDWAYYLKLFPEKLQTEIKSFRFKKDRYNCLFGKLLVYSGYFLLKGEKICFENEYLRDQYNKPFVKESDTKFNITHSGNMVMCAFNESDIGVDLEIIKSIHVEDYKSCFSFPEMEEIRNNKVQKFYELWTMKEAVSKAIGRGLGIPLEDLNMNQKKEVSYKESKWNIKHGSILEYYYSLATKDINDNIEIIKIEF